MYRDFVKRNAKKLGLTGTVENIPDGSVLVIVEGEEGALKKLIPLLWEGPLISRMVAKIDGVEETWGEATKTFPDFKILY